MASISRAVCLLLVSVALFQSAVHARGLTASLQLVERLPRTEKPVVDVITDALEELTNLSAKVLDDVEKIENSNADEEGGKIAEGITEIINKLNETSQAIPQYPGSVDYEDADRVVSDFVEFVRAQRRLLDTVIEKHELETLKPHFKDIRRALVQLDLIGQGPFFKSLATPLNSSGQFRLARHLGPWINTLYRARSTYRSPSAKTFLAHAFH